MGILERFRPTASVPWRPPSLGTCQCKSHVEDLLEEVIPLADGSGTATVAAVVTAGTLTAVPTPEALWIEEPGSVERRGPYHWRVVHQRGLDPFLGAGAPASLDDVVFLQPGVETVLWLEDRTVLALGAPSLCVRGVQAAMVRALMNPRLRTLET